MLFGSSFQHPKSIKALYKANKSQGKVSMSQVICKIREVAERVVASYMPYYSPEFLQAIPDELLERDLTFDNITEAERQIGLVRFEKEWELIGGREGRTRMPGYLKEWIKQTISDPDETETLPADQQQKVKEILFLYALADTVIQILYPCRAMPNNISSRICQDYHKA
jgi:hypothetical protein